MAKTPFTPKWRESSRELSAADDFGALVPGCRRPVKMLCNQSCFKVSETPPLHSHKLMHKMIGSVTLHASGNI